MNLFSAIRTRTGALCPTRHLATALIALTALTAPFAFAEPEALDWQRFELDGGHKAFVLLPEAPAGDKPTPWVMYAPTFHTSLPNERDEGWMIRRWLDAGIAVAGVDIGESYGSPAGRAVYNQLHANLIAKHGLAQKASLLARSRGGLMLYNWAAENPDKVCCIAGIYPVCDPRSYPGLAKAAGAYKMTAAELEAKIAEHNPVQRLAPLAKAGVPIYHIHGDVDTVVPLEANSGAVAEAYQKLGGKMKLFVPPGQGHNMWRGFFEHQALVDFVIANSAPDRKEPSLPTPAAHWKLDDEGDVATDSAGGHHGKVVGAVPAEGKIGKGRLFDRTKGDHIAIPYSKEFGLSTFTVSAWVKLTREPTFSGILGTRFGLEHTFDMKVNDAKVHGDIGDGEKWIATAVNFYADNTGSDGQGGDLAVGKWFHIVFVIDDGEKQCRLYLDADLKKTIPFKGTPILMQPGQEMHIGHSSSDEFMDGVIDEVRIYGEALRAEQVRALHAR